MTDDSLKGSAKFVVFKELLKIISVYVLVSVAVWVFSNVIEMPMSIMVDIIDILTVIYTVWLLRRNNAASLKDRIDFKNFSIFDAIVMTLLGYAFSEIINFADGMILSGFFSVEPNETVISGAFVIPAVVFIGPVCEELIFRYGITELLRERFRPWFVILFTTALFAVSHSYNIQGILNVFFSILPAILICFYTKNMLYSIFSHILHNAMCYIPSEGLYYEKNGFDIPNIYYLVICIVICILCTIWLIRSFVPKYMKKTE